MNAFLVMNVIVMAVITDNLGTKNFNAHNCAKGWRLLEAKARRLVSS